MAIAGIDIGSTGCKIAVYDEGGSHLFSAYRDYPVSRTTSEHEVDPRAIWAGVGEIIAEAAGRVPGIAGIGVSSFGESFILLDERDEPLMNVMLYTDPRGQLECRELSEKLGAEHIASITGVMPHSMYSLPKLMWVLRNRPETYERARRILLIEDYVVYMLTGNAQIDYSLAARTMALDIHQRDWSDELLRAAGVDRALLSKPVPTGSAAGPLRAALRERFGLSGATQIVSCCHDQISAAVGAGALTEGLAADGAGTVECITPVFRAVDSPKVLYEGGYAIIPFVKEGLFVTYAFSFTGGALVKWFTDRLAGYAAVAAREKGGSIYEELERGMGEAPTGILVLPHFAGAGTPYMDAGAKGAITGLAIEHSLSDLYQAVLEGVAYEMRVNMERLEEAGIRFDHLNATGGGAKSEKWLQIKADVLGREIVSLGDSEAGILGGIMLTGVAAGAFESLEEARSRFIRELGVYRPDPVAHERYAAHYARYKRLYEAVRSVN